MKWLDLGLLTLRVGLAASMWKFHVIRKLEDVSGELSTFPDPLGLGHAPSFALALCAEAACTLLVAIGFGTRLFAAPIVFTMTMVLVLGAQGLESADIQSALLYALPYAFLMLTGPGRWSLDHLLRRHRRRALGYVARIARRSPPRLGAAIFVAAVSTVSYGSADEARARPPQAAGGGVVPRRGRSHLTFGGQHRLRYELLEPTSLGVGAQRTARSVLLSRNLLHANLDVAEGIRLFGQLGSFIALGSPSKAAPPDADDLDVTQLFLESGAKLGRMTITSRAGRQEMTLGSTRWVSTRDGTNVRQAFDIVRTTVAVPDRLSVEAFFGTTPELRRRAFDDSPAWQDGFWGTYATMAVLPRKLFAVDAFYLGRRRHRAEYSVVAGREVRHTFGVRLFGETPWGLEYIEHAMVQVGSTGDRSVLAWGFAAAFWQHLRGPLAPVHVGIRMDALSGDSRPADGRLTTFHPLFPNQTFFSALPAIFPTNLYDVHPLVRIQSARLSVESGCVFFWRQAVEDAIYRPPGSPLLSGAASSSAMTPRYIGAQASLAIAYRADRHLSFNAEASRIFAGAAIAAEGGTDVNFFGTWTTYTY